MTAQGIREVPGPDLARPYWRTFAEALDWVAWDLKVTPNVRWYEGLPDCHGFANPTLGEVWLAADLDPADAALVMAHETFHLTQGKEASSCPSVRSVLAKSAAGDTAEWRRHPLEADAKAYARRVNDRLNLKSSLRWMSWAQ